MKLARRFRPLLDLYAAIVRATYLPALKWVAKMHMVRLSDMAEGDINLVFSKVGAEPLVIVKSSGHRAIPLSVVFDEITAWYSKLAIAEMKPRFSFNTVTPLLMEFSLRGSPNED